MKALGVLCPFDPSADPGPPEATALGRAALTLEDEGIAVLFGDDAADGVLRGRRAAHLDGAGRAGASRGRWVEDERPVAAVYDRYPDQSRPQAYERAVAGLSDVPRANPSSLVALCRDKLACQRWLVGRGVAMPDVEDDPERFEERLAAWGAAFLKPRYGAFGAGVSRVVPGDALPAVGRGLYGDEPHVLQRAVAPPDGWAGICVRALAQRSADGWVLAPLVARRHRDDPVVNVARGAEAAPAEDALPPSTVDRLVAEALSACEALSAAPDGGWLVEVGVDLVVGRDGVPVVIEANGRPRGRVGVIASRDPGRFAAAAADAALRPLRYLAGRAGLV